MIGRRFHIGDSRPATLTDRHMERRFGSGRSGRYCVVGASVRGKLHVRHGTPRDDAFACRSDGTLLAAAVSDGVGSRPLSRYGAAYAVDRLVRRLVIAARRSKQSPMSDALMLDAFTGTRADVEGFARGRGRGPEELHCTLLGLILNLQLGDIAVGQIGDGLILALAPGNKVVRLTEPLPPTQPGATYSLMQDGWQKHFCCKTVIGGEARTLRTLYLMTDGVADDIQLGPPQDILSRWVSDMDREVRAYPPKVTTQRLKRYLATYEARSSFDDRTVVIIYGDKS